MSADGKVESTMPPKRGTLVLFIQVSQMDWGSLVISHTSIVDFSLLIETTYLQEAGE